ncbi:MAG: fumarylacetoacetate hydrolase family protein [Longimicrobiales bacterium]|nr:fumarylacetoacetate hydrolase family protein [Longimicrobiales bacterium]
MTALALPRPTKIVCVGRNYVKHAEELGNSVPEEPLLFLKPPSALIADGAVIVRPPESDRVEHEAEIAVVIGATCRHVAEGDALAHVAGLAALNDVTARDLQRRDGQWTRAKGFDTFCPVGPVVAAEGVDWDALEVTCSVDGQLRQHGHARDMAFPIPALIAYISGVMTLEPGDLIATGTPEGVGPLPAGCRVTVEVRVAGVPVSTVTNRVAAGA